MIGDLLLNHRALLNKQTIEVIERWWDNPSTFIIENRIQLLSEIEDNEDKQIVTQVIFRDQFGERLNLLYVDPETIPEDKRKEVLEHLDKLKKELKQWGDDTRKVVNYEKLFTCKRIPNG